jgi:hypothetical protein
MHPSREEDMIIPPPRAVLHFRKHRRSILGSSGTQLSLLLKIRKFGFPAHIRPGNRNITNLSGSIKKKSSRALGSFEFWVLSFEFWMRCWVLGEYLIMDDGL